MIANPDDAWTITERGIPLYLNNTLFIRADKLDVYVDALRTVLVKARAEPGCRYLYVGSPAGQPTVFVLSEAWRDLVEYRDEILARDYFRTYLEISESVYEKPREVRILNSFDDEYGDEFDLDEPEEPGRPGAAYPLG